MLTKISDTLFKLIDEEMFHTSFINIVIYTLIELIIKLLFVIKYQL